MFFSVELLSRRDSGFGLLWYAPRYSPTHWLKEWRVALHRLAATLGSKSSFKKLPKRSVMTADIAQLCGLIAEPSEPLALRLSSNLMVGVVRVYKVKQDIFMTDVSTCYHSLKKAVHDMRSLGVTSAEALQMGQTSARPDTLTLVAGADVAFALDFADMDLDWDLDLNRDAEDPDYGTRAKRKPKPKQRSTSLAEQPRANLHTLQEDHSQFLSGSFDVSFSGADRSGRLDPSSSQVEGLGFVDDNLFSGDHALDFGGMRDELVQELGADWDVPPGQSRFADDDQPFFGAYDAGGMDLAFGEPAAFSSPDRLGHPPATPLRQRSQDHVGDDLADLHRQGTRQPEDERDAPQPSFAEEAFQEYEGAEAGPNEQPLHAPRPPKRARLLVDRRTDLGDEELKSARTNYLQGQEQVHQELLWKRFEKDGGKLVEDLIWGAGAGQVSSLRTFWLDRFKAQSEARSEAWRARAHGFDEDSHPAKRPRLGSPQLQQQGEIEQSAAWDIDMPHDFGVGLDQPDDEAFRYRDDTAMRSSEEPGQARHMSRPPSIFGGVSGLGLDVPYSASNFAPWDEPSSSAAGVVGMPSDISVHRADTRLSRSLSQSRRESFSVREPGDVPMSPGGEFLRMGSQVGFDDFMLPAEATQEPQQSALEDTQQSEINLANLERRSSNFLRYCKTQLQSLPEGSSRIYFDSIVPNVRKVAAEGFYHCLVLATKNLLHVKQTEAYGSIEITVIP